MSRFAKQTKQQIRERLETERKDLALHENRMQQLATNPIVYEFIKVQFRANDCLTEIKHLEDQLNDPRRPD